MSFLAKSEVSPSVEEPLQIKYGHCCVCHGHHMRMLPKSTTCREPDWRAMSVWPSAVECRSRGNCAVYSNNTALPPQALHCESENST